MGCSQALAIQRTKLSAREPEPKATEPQAEEFFKGLPSSSPEEDSEPEEGAPCSSEEGCKAFATGLEELRAGTATELHLSKCDMEDVGARQLARALARSAGGLLTLNLSVNRLTDAGAQALSAVLPYVQVQVLSFERNELTAHGALCLASNLPRTLEKLLLGRNALGAGGAAAVADQIALGQGPTLHTLGMGFAGLGEAGAQALVPTFTKLKVLDVAGNRLGAEGSFHIAAGLRSGFGLEVLKLESNGLGDEGAKAIASAVAAHRTLKTLSLRRNSIQDAGAKSLADALCQNSVLTDLDLFDNSISDAGARHFLRCHTSALRKINLDVNAASFQMMAKIGGALSK